MRNLGAITTDDLIQELKAREKVRSMEINKNEVYKAQAAGLDDSMSRYIKGEGPAIILEIKGR